MDPRGRTYTVADGRQIPNKGKKEFSGFSGDGTPIEMGINITDVVKILFSVRSMCRAGNVVLFGADEGSFVINKKSGNVTKIDDDGVNYTLSMFVKKPKVPDPPENKFPRKREKSRFENKTALTQLLEQQEEDSEAEKDNATFTRQQ